LALASDEAEVFLATHRCANTGRSHGLPPRATLRRVLRGLRRPHPRHGFRASRDRLDDVVVAGAAAEIAFELLADGVLVELVALAVDHVHRGHHYARRAEAALQAVMLAERLLHRMQRPVRLSQPLD